MTTTTAVASLSSNSSKNMQTAHLHRVARLHDRAEATVFTFILPPHLTKGYLQDCYSKDFTYGYQKWRVQFTRDDKHLGVYLIHRTPSDFCTVDLDFSFTILNREHFTNNESCQQKQSTFTIDTQRIGRSTFLGVYDLQKRGFMFPDQRALIELEMKSIATHFAETIPMPRDPKEMMTLDRVETAYFSFANCDWNLAIYIKEEDNFGVLHPCHPNMMIFRHSRFDHWCRVKYKVSFQYDNVSYATEIIDQMLDIKGYGQNHPLKGVGAQIFTHLHSKHDLHVKITMIAMWPVTIVDLAATNTETAKNISRCYDTDKQQWSVESDVLGRLLKLRLYYTDVKNVPRHFSRCLCWNACVIPYSRDKHIVKSINGPFCNYYSQKESDEGYEIEMDLAVEEICDPSGGYIEPDTGFFTAQIEWLQSHLVYHDFYHHYDDISRLHKHQMSREVATLQAENYSLEKQIFSYQLSISRKDAGMDAISHGSFEGNESKDSGISGDVIIPTTGYKGGRQLPQVAANSHQLLDTTDHISAQSIKQKYGL